MLIAGFTVGLVIATFKNDGTEADTVVTVPVPGAAGVCQTSEVPFEVRTWFTVPMVVRPVPPDVIGSAVPDKDIASVPADVIGEFAIDKNEGTVAPTDVTVPPNPGLIVVHDVCPAPLVVKTCPKRPRSGGRARMYILTC